METPLRVVIIGNSAAGLSALEAFRKLDSSSSVHVISREGPFPYARVQIPYYLKDRVRLDNLYIREADYLDDLNAEMVEGCVSALDVTTSSVILEDGRAVAFDRLLIASGSSPVVPSITGIGSAGIHHIWTMDDALALKPAFETGKRILIIGGGFIAMQAAWAAAQRELSVMLVVRSTIMRRDLDDQARELLKRSMADHGVSLVEGEMPSAITENSDRSLRVEFRDRQSVEVDHVVVATGVQPNTAFLGGSGIAVDGGILVDRHMQTNIPGIYAAGDVAAAKTSDGRDHVVRALWPCAAEQGEVAGRNLAGCERTYQGSLNMNVTELFGLVVASMGRFVDTDGKQVWKYGAPGRGTCLSVVLEDGIPIGGLAVGDADGLAALGMLRPYIRQHRYLGMERPDDLLQALQLRLFPAALSGLTILNPPAFPGDTYNPYYGVN